MGATDPKKADEGHDPRRLRRQHRRQRRARLRRAGNGRRRDRLLLPRHERLRALAAARATARMARQPARLRPRRPGGVLRRAGREAFSRGPAVSLDPPEGRGRLRTHDRPGQVRCATSSPASPCVRAPPLISEQPSADGTIKWLFDVGGGDAVETVFIPEADRGTLCVSSQAGCAVGCRFCSHRPPGLQPQPEHRRDRRPALVRRAPAAPAAAAARRRARDQQRRDDGHGRAAAELRGAACRRCA